MTWLVDHLAVVMFFALVAIMFLGYPVAFLLGAVGIGFGFLGVAFDIFKINQFANLLPRVYGQAVQNQVLVAIPMFVFMGTMLEKSGVAETLLNILQQMLRRVPGGLAIAVTVLGTIMAARHVGLVASGAAKAEAVHQLAEGSVSALWPATILQHHPHVTVLLDEAAASRLQLTGYYRETYASKPAWQGL